MQLRHRQFCVRLGQSGVDGPPLPVRQRRPHVIQSLNDPPDLRPQRLKVGWRIRLDGRNSDQRKSKTQQQANFHDKGSWRERCHFRDDWRVRKSAETRLGAGRKVAL